MPTSALSRIGVRADVGIGPYGRFHNIPTNPDLRNPRGPDEAIRAPGVFVPVYAYSSSKAPV